MLLKDKILQERLETDGYIILPLLSKDEVASLNEFYNSIHSSQEPPDFIENIHMTIWCKDYVYKEKVRTHLERFFHSSTQFLFDKTRTLNHVFIVKRSGAETTFKVHQDWSVIDETKYQSVNVWVPLHDVNKDGGALWVVKGSHKINRPIRGAGYLFPDYSPHIKELEKVAVSVNLKAGEAIVFYHSLIHGSPPNLTSDYRKAACFTVIPEEAPLCIYFQKDKASKLEKHEPKDDFMFRYDHLRTETFTNAPTQNPVTFSEPYVNEVVSEREIGNILNSDTRFSWRFWR